MHHTSRHRLYQLHCKQCLLNMQKSFKKHKHMLSFSIKSTNVWLVSLTSSIRKNIPTPNKNMPESFKIHGQLFSVDFETMHAGSIKMRISNYKNDWMARRFPDGTSPFSCRTCWTAIFWFRIWMPVTLLYLNWTVICLLLVD